MPLFLPAPAQGSAAARCAHAGPETDLFLAAPFVGLKCPFHEAVILSFDQIGRNLISSTKILIPPSEKKI